MAGYTTAPPDDSITILSTTSADNMTTIVYAWDAAPSVPAGTMTMELAGDLVASLTVRLRAPAGAG